MTENFKNLIVWQKSIDLVIHVYKITNKFPKEELFGLTSQIRRAVTSIPANIAEGKMRGTNPEFKRFLYVAFGSGGELETHMEVAKRLKYVTVAEYDSVQIKLTEILKIIRSLINKI